MGVLGTISSLARRCDTEDQRSVSNLVSDAALALFRKESDWISASLKVAKARDFERAESKFSEFSLRERAKVERETFNTVRGLNKSDKRVKESRMEAIGRPTVAVVTFILALEGRTLPEVKDLSSLRATLLRLGTDALENSSLMAAEVMWSPEEPWDVLTPEE